MTRSGKPPTGRTVLIWVALVAALAFIFGPVLGLRETGAERRSRLTQEEFERRVDESLRRAAEDRARSDRELERAKNEIFPQR